MRRLLAKFLLAGLFVAANSSNRWIADPMKPWRGHQNF